VVRNGSSSGRNVWPLSAPIIVPRGVQTSTPCAINCGHYGGHGLPKASQQPRQREDTSRGFSSRVAHGGSLQYKFESLTHLSLIRRRCFFFFAVYFPSDMLLFTCVFEYTSPRLAEYSTRIRQLFFVYFKTAYNCHL
jgi:hypothetical protein